jgi:hypothetical protein
MLKKKVDVPKKGADLKSLPVSSGYKGKFYRVLKGKSLEDLPSEGVLQPSKQREGESDRDWKARQPEGKINSFFGNNTQWVSSTPVGTKEFLKESMFPLTQGGEVEYPFYKVYELEGKGKKFLDVTEDIRKGKDKELRLLQSSRFTGGGTPVNNYVKQRNYYASRHPLESSEISVDGDMKISKVLESGDVRELYGKSGFTEKDVLNKASRRQQARDREFHFQNESIEEGTPQFDFKKKFEAAKTQQELVDIVTAADELLNDDGRREGQEQAPI